MRWLNNFNSDYYYTCDKKTMVDTITSLYGHFDKAEEWYNINVVEYYSELESQVFSKWKKCFDAFIPKQVKGDSASINQQTSVCYDTFIKSLKRTQISLGNDLRAIYNNKHKFDVIYTDNHTHLSKDKNYIPIDPMVEVKEDNADRLVQPYNNLFYEDTDATENN